MSYEKQTWANGDVITAEKLNHMEDGIAGAGGLVVRASLVDESTPYYVLDKTYSEILAAYTNRQNITFWGCFDDGDAIVYNTFILSEMRHLSIAEAVDDYIVVLVDTSDPSNPIQFSSETSDGVLTAAVE